MKKMYDKVVYSVPVVVLENSSIPKRKKKKCQQNGKSGNEEPKRKKFKTENEEIEVPKRIKSKNRNPTHAELKFSNKNIQQNPQNNDLPLPSVEMYTGLENHPNKKTRILKKKFEKKIGRSTLTNSLSVGKIKIRDVNTINENVDLNHDEIMLFDEEKYEICRVNNTIPLIFLNFETNQLTLQYFELLHEKYFDRYVQDTIVIINNIVFMNYIIDIISNFEDSDYEHAFLMLVLSLFTSLKMFGSNVFRNNSVILKKLERLQWESVKHQHFDHSRVQMIFKSDAFCSSYHKLSKFIGEGSYTDPIIVKWWELFCSPAVFKTNYFHSAIKAITNSACIDKVVSLIDKASNNIRMCSHLKDGENLSIYEKHKLEKLIALVNDSARVNTNNNETIRPCTSGFDALDQTNQSMMSIGDGHTFTSNMSLEKTLKSSELITINENISEAYSKNTLTTHTPHNMKVGQVKNTSTSVHADSFQKSEPIKSKNICTSHNIALHTRTLKHSNSNSLGENCPNTLTDIPTSTPTSVKIYPLRNTQTPHLNTVPLIHTYLHKKFNSTIQIGNVEHRVNRTLFHQMISQPTEASIKLISNTSLNNHIDFNNIGAENSKNDTITQLL